MDFSNVDCSEYTFDEDLKEWVKTQNGTKVILPSIKVVSSATCGLTAPLTDRIEQNNYQCLFKVIDCSTENAPECALYNTFPTFLSS